MRVGKWLKWECDTAQAVRRPELRAAKRASNKAKHVCKAGAGKAMLRSRAGHGIHAHHARILGIPHAEGRREKKQQTETETESKQ